MDDVKPTLTDHIGETADERFRRRLHERRPAGLSPQARQWVEDNRAAIEAFNAWDEQHGSPLDTFRTF